MLKKYSWSYLVAYFLLPTLYGCKTTTKTFYPTEIYPKVCYSGLYKGPNEKFGVYVFCDDAEGTTIGIINITPGAYVEPGSEKAWTLDGRFWQDSKWARDVVSFTWLQDGLLLSVKTSPIYGTGKTYLLDLVNKKIIKEE